MHFVHWSNIPFSLEKYVISKPRRKDGWRGKWIRLVTHWLGRPNTHTRDLLRARARVLRACHLDVFTSHLIVSFVNAYFRKPIMDLQSYMCSFLNCQASKLLSTKILNAFSCLKNRAVSLNLILMWALDLVLFFFITVPRLCFLRLFPLLVIYKLNPY